MIRKGNTKKNTIKYNIGTNLFLYDLSAIHSAPFKGILDSRGFRYITKIPKILKNKCANDATNAVTLRVKAATNAVTVVPILAPSVNG